MNRLKKFNKPKVEIINEKEDKDYEDNKPNKNGAYGLGINFDLIYGYNCIRYDLRVCKPDVSNADIIKDIQKREPLLNTIYYPRECDIADVNPYFSIDKNGRMLLFGKQCDTVIKTLKKLDFEQAIKSKLNYINFTLPQEKAIIEGDFCNESVYGNCKVLFVTGLIKIEATPINKSFIKSADDVTKLKKELALHLLSRLRNNISIEEYDLISKHIHNINDDHVLVTVTNLINHSFYEDIPINDKILTDKINEMANEAALIKQIFEV